MGNIAKHTDLSAEQPSARAHVDVPFEEAGSRISWHRAPFVMHPGWMPYDSLVFGLNDDDVDEA